MSIIAHQVRSVAATETPYDDFFRAEHLRSSTQGLHSVFVTTQAFLEGDAGIIAFKTHTGDIMTITPSGYSLLGASYKDNTYCLGTIDTGAFETRIRFAIPALNPLEQQGDNIALLSTSNELLIYRLENKQLTKKGVLSLYGYLMNAKHNVGESCSDNQATRGDTTDANSAKTVMNGKESDTHDILDTLIASYQNNISSKFPMTKSKEDITEYPCSCAIGKELLAFSIDRRLYLVRVSDASSCNMPATIFKHAFSSEINSLYMLSDGPKDVTLVISSESTCTIIKITELGTGSSKSDIRTFSLSQPASRDSLAYITAVAVSPFVADYWMLGTNQGQLLIMSPKSEQPIFSTLLFSLPITSLSFSSLQPDVFSVSSRYKVMICQYVFSLVVMAQFIAPQFVSIIAGGIHCIAPAQPLSLWYGLDNNKLVFESLGVNYSKWTRKIVMSFLRGVSSMQLIYDKVLCTYHQYSAEFVENYISFSSLLYARDFRRCYSFIFSLVNAIDESGMPLATELMQYFFGLLRPIQQYFQASQTISVPKPVPLTPSLNKVLAGFSLSIPSSLDKRYCLMPSLTEALQYSAYEIRFRLDDTCSRMKLSESQLKDKLLKELNMLLDKSVEVCLKVKDDPIVSLVLLRYIFDVAILIDRKRHDVTVYRYFSELLDVLRANPNAAATFLKPVYPSILSLRGTIRLDEFFIAAVAPIKHIINNFTDSKDTKQGDLNWSEHAIWALYTSVLHPSTRSIADCEYRDNVSTTEYPTLTALLSRTRPTADADGGLPQDVISSFEDLCRKQDKLFGVIAESNRMPMTPGAFTELLDGKLDNQLMGSQFVLLESLYSYIYSHTIKENLRKLEEVCTSLIAIFNDKIIGIDSHRQNGSTSWTESGIRGVVMGAAVDKPIEMTGSSQKDKIYKHFSLVEVTTPVKRYEGIFVPFPILGAIYGIIMTVFWPRTLYDLNKRIGSVGPDLFSEFLVDLCEILTNVYVMANISPNEFIERYVPSEVCNIFRYNIQGTRVRGILERFIKLYVSNIQKTSDPAKVAIYQQDMATCKMLMSFFASVRLAEFESAIDKLQREISNALA
ncbi:Hypothetical protein GLP15_2971 [Giardia lamblia P15]|uniref:Uncharacterized protein n=1 Tax=Giardia intestinalis (strain P15) TaxID=658858 RepID=E1EYV9_GIAIA|nr:Hypothetical protein GLP15_2971 [Giardia lamblia P15]